MEELVGFPEQEGTGVDRLLRAARQGVEGREGGCGGGSTGTRSERLRSAGRERQQEGLPAMLKRFGVIFFALASMRG